MPSCTARLIAFVIAFFSASLFSDDVVVVTTNGPDGELLTQVDNNGGYGIPHDSPTPDEGRFRMVLAGIDQFGEGSLNLTDGQMVYNGRQDENPTAFSSFDSGIMVWNPVLNMGSVEIATGAPAIGNYLPSTFSSFDGRFNVYQSTFSLGNQQFIVYQWTIQNTGGTPAATKAFFLIDWDLHGSEADSESGWDSTRNLAFQRDGAGSNWTHGGVALIEGTLHNYHLGFYDEVTNDLRDNNAKLLDYFTNPNSPHHGNNDNIFVADRITGVSADLGTLQPGQMACVAFAQAIAKATPQNNSEEGGRAALQAQVDLATAMYSTVPAQHRCQQSNAMPPNINAGMNSAWVNANAPLQGHFLTVYPNAGLIFQSWFTFDSVVQAQATTKSAGARAKLEQAATFGADDQRWVTALGVIDGNKAVLAVENTSGGIFNGAEPVASQDGNYGTITLEFLSCNEAIMTYEFPSVGLSGTDTLTRAIDDSEICEMLAAGGN